MLSHGQLDHERGLYYAFPFLAGTRISEQLGLLWEDVDLDAGMRDIPMSPMLNTMLIRWRLDCPRLDGELHRVFPGPGRLQP